MTSRDIGSKGVVVFLQFKHSGWLTQIFIHGRTQKNLGGGAMNVEQGPSGYVIRYRSWKVLPIQPFLSPPNHTYHTFPRRTRKERRVFNFSSFSAYLAPFAVKYSPINFILFTHPKHSGVPFFPQELPPIWFRIHTVLRSLRMRKLLKPSSSIRSGVRRCYL